MNALFTVSVGQSLSLWGDLVEAYHGVHGYGGHVAELYAYRLMYGALGDGEPVALVRAKYSACHYAKGPGDIPCYRIDGSV